jgi:hypothetical protein
MWAIRNRSLGATFFTKPGKNAMPNAAVPLCFRKVRRCKAFAIVMIELDDEYCGS